MASPLLIIFFVLWVWVWVFKNLGEHEMVSDEQQHKTLLYEVGGSEKEEKEWGGSTSY